MAYFANLDDENIVTQVIFVDNLNAPDEETGIAYCNSVLLGRWIQTSYNSKIRKNYAGVGYTYDEIRDAFIPPKPTDFPSFILDYEKCLWATPIPRPDGDEPWGWNESTQEWVIMDIPVLENEVLPPTTGE
jgi:hypothetical protein